MQENTEISINFRFMSYIGDVMAAIHPSQPLTKRPNYAMLIHAKSIPYHEWLRDGPDDTTATGVPGGSARCQIPQRGTPKER